MSKKKKGGWTVLVHMRWGYKLKYEMDGDDIDMEAMAHEHARMIMEGGPYIENRRGIRTYFNPRDIHKIKVIPPGAPLGSTKSSYD